MVRSKKRYVLLAVDCGEDVGITAKLGRILELRHGKVTLIPVGGHQGYLIVKTSPKGAAEMRESVANLEIVGKKVVSLLTSGCIGKLKRLANQRTASVVAKVSKRRVLQEPRDSTGERPEVER